MKLHYSGRYSLDPASLPNTGHRPGAVAFKEVQDTKALSFVANGLAVLLMILLAIPVFFRCLSFFDSDQLVLSCVFPMFTLLPHELLHALCFREDVYLYTNLRQGMLFVIGPEDMSKSRFILMSLLPNLVFGFLPYALGMAFPQWMGLAVFGALCIGIGAGDYYNVFNALTQVPNGAKIYTYGINSFWYRPI